MKVQMRSINHSSRAVVLGAIASSVVGFSVIPSVFAQSPSNIRLVDYAAPVCSSPSITLRPTMQTNGTSVAEAKGRDPGENLINPTAATSADRWLKFEREYGIQEECAAAIGRLFQAAKYGLDRVTFTAQETAKRCEFSYDLGCAPANGSGSR